MPHFSFLLSSTSLVRSSSRLSRRLVSLSLRRAVARLLSMITSFPNREPSLSLSLFLFLSLCLSLSLSFSRGEKLELLHWHASGVRSYHTECQEVTEVFVALVRLSVSNVSPLASVRVNHGAEKVGR